MFSYIDIYLKLNRKLCLNKYYLIRILSILVSAGFFVATSLKTIYFCYTQGTAYLWSIHWNTTIIVYYGIIVTFKQ